jgi:4-hydroxy-3-methylbut-2-enyl diphosphate reductase
MLTILRAEAMGMCFGVRDALERARAQADPERIAIHGELVHNETVLTELRGRGYTMVSETGREELPRAPKVMITAHGVSDAERERLERAGKELIDTTCPLVRRVHRDAQRLARDGRLVVVIGKPDHVEVRGIVGDLARYDVVAKPEEARRYTDARIGVICQTTTAPAQAGRVLDEIRRHNPHADIEYLATMCRPTLDRQAALEKLIGRVDGLVVVGGQRSNNTRRLAERARERGVPAIHVWSPDQVDGTWLDGKRTVGLTAGTSTPDVLIDAIERRLRQLVPRSRTESVA